MSKNEVPPAGKRDAYVRKHMRNIAGKVASMLPKRWGFIVMAFPFGEAPGRFNYMSNARREDVIKELKAFIAMHEQGHNIFSHLPDEIRTEVDKEKHEP